jgi:hypothetical protein
LNFRGRYLDLICVLVHIRQAFEERSDSEKDGSGYKKMKEWFTEQAMEQCGSAAARDRAPLNILPGARSSSGLTRKIELVSD